MKTFTVEEANALLPTVSVILEKIQHAHKRLLLYKESASKAATSAEQGGGGMPEGVHYAALLTELTLLMGELEALGVQLKDFERGLIDFPSLREGRIVLLCWQIGEGDELKWWHDIDAGFAGRMPI